MSIDRIDVFVHPEAGNHKWQDMDIYNQYISELETIARNSSLPILINGDRDKLFKKIIHQGNQINSKDGWTGYVSDEDWDKFVRLIGKGKNANILIHGSYLDRCTRAFVLQLLPYILEGDHRYLDKEQHNSKPTPESIKRDISEKVYIFDGSFLRSNIKYGCVFSSKGDVYTWNTTIKNPEEGLPFGCASFQLIGPDTTIYGVWQNLYFRFLPDPKRKLTKLELRAKSTQNFISDELAII